MDTPTEDDVARFVERFAAALVEAGVPRMPARVFAALLSADSGRLTAAELAERLHTSPASVSTAVRYLAQVNLVSRERERGSRRDVIVVHGDIWYEALVRRDAILVRWEDALRDGIQTLGADSPAGQRLTGTLEFFEFIGKELPAMLQRWRATRG
ncbi:MAG TPA: MarR family transcriptional regulator [Pseudonocardiaceae bacterium]